MALLFLPAAALAAALLPAFAQASPLSLDAALDMAVQRSSAARSARAAVAGAREMAFAAGQFPDPTLRVGVENLPVTGPDRLRTDRDFQTMKRIGIGQEWVSRDKRAARQAAAEAAVGREAVQEQTAIGDARLQTALAYLDAFYAGEALKLATLNEHHAHDEFEAARGRLSSATGNSQEVLALTASRGLAADESAEVRQQQGTAQVALERWVGARADELMAIPTAATPTEQAYVDAHPAVMTLRLDRDVARQGAALAAANRAPNWSWEVSYGQRTGYSDMISFAVSIPIPVAPAQRQDRETASKLALLDKADADLVEAERAASAEYRALTSDARRLQERIEGYRASVVVPAEQRTAAAIAAYRSNQTSLVALFEARHAEVEMQRKLLALQRDLARTNAQLAFKPLTGSAR